MFDETWWWSRTKTGKNAENLRDPGAAALHLLRSTARTLLVFYMYSKRDARSASSRGPRVWFLLWSAGRGRASRESGGANNWR
jgi:hypothetical protein